MSDTLINLDAATLPLQDTDLLYLVRGTGVDRDMKTTVGAMVDKVEGNDNHLTGKNTFSKSPGGTRLGIGGTNPLAIPLYGLDADSPEYLVNAGYVILGMGFMTGMAPSRWLIFSATGVAAQVGTTQAVSDCYTCTAGGALTTRTVGAGDFTLTGKIIEVMWDGANAYFTILAT